MTEEMTAHQKQLCIGDAIAVLQLVAAREGELIHINEMPWSLASGMWILKQEFFTSREIGREKFQCFITAAGLEFLREQGVAVKTKLVNVVMPRTAPAKPLEFDHVYVQYRNGRIREFWDLEALPKRILDTLRLGLLAVYNGDLYGISEAHILGNGN